MRNTGHLAAPMSGVVCNVFKAPGDRVRKGDQVLAIEAMKMITNVTAKKDGFLVELLTDIGINVKSKDLLAVIGSKSDLH